MSTSYSERSRGDTYKHMTESMGSAENRRSQRCHGDREGKPDFASRHQGRLSDREGRVLEVNVVREGKSGKKQTWRHQQPRRAPSQRGLTCYYGSFMTAAYFVRSCSHPLVQGLRSLRIHHLARIQRFPWHLQEVFHRGSREQSSLLSYGMPSSLPLPGSLGSAGCCQFC